MFSFFTVIVIVNIYFTDICIDCHDVRIVLIDSMVITLLFPVSFRVHMKETYRFHLFCSVILINSDCVPFGK